MYSGFTNHFNIGAFMEKGLTMRAGQAHTPSLLLSARLCCAAWQEEHRVAQGWGGCLVCHWWR